MTGMIMAGISVLHLHRIFSRGILPSLSRPWVDLLDFREIKEIADLATHRFPEKHHQKNFFMIPDAPSRPNCLNGILDKIGDTHPSDHTTLYRNPFGKKAPGRVFDQQQRDPLPILLLE